MQRGSVHLFLIILILTILVVGGSIFYKNSVTVPVSNLLKPIQQEKLSSYSSNLGFSFSYQKDFSIKEDSEEDFNKRGNGDFRKNFKGYVGYEPPPFGGAIAVLGRDNNFDNNPFTVWIFNNDSNLTQEQWFDKYWYYPFVWGVFDYTSKGHIALDAEATISGVLAKSKIISYQPGSPKFIYVAKNSKMYLIRIIDDKNKTGDQILSSLKFL